MQVMKTSEEKKASEIRDGEKDRKVAYIQHSVFLYLHRKSLKCPSLCTSK